MRRHSGRGGRALALVGALLAIPAAAQPVGNAQPFSIGGWDGEARFREGYFTHCVMVRKYESGATLRFAINRGNQLSIGIDDPAWERRRPRGQIRLQIDKSGALTADAVVIEGEVSAVFNPDPDLVRRFRAGRTLVATHGETTGEYALEGSNEALAQLQRCAATFN